MIKHIKLALIVASFLILFGNLKDTTLSNSVDTNYATKFEINQPTYEQVENFEVKMASSPKIKFFSTQFNYYSLEEINGIYIANIFEFSNYSNILEVKLISNDFYYDYNGYTSLYNYNYVLETIYMEGKTMIKEFFVPSLKDINIIIKNHKTITNNDKVYTKLITSITSEADFKASKSNLYSITPLNESITTTNCDNQAILDYYLSVKNIKNETINTGSINAKITQISSSDDPIIHLIPKDYFRYNGIHKGLGAEWGYFIKTYNDYSQNKISSVLIFDIETIKYTSYQPHIVTIKPILAMNYKYIKDTDVVIKDTPNNYCLGNPKYELALKYVKLADNKNDFTPINFGDPQYNYKKDEGYTIYSTQACFNGTVKSYNGDLKKFTNLGLFLGNVALSLATSGLNLPAQIAIGATSTLIGNVIADIENKVIMNFDDDDNIKIVDYKIPGETNYNALQDLNKLMKYVKLQLSNENGNFNFNETSNPLLFKNNNHYIGYVIGINASEEDTRYVVQLGNRLTVDIFNDNTSIIKQNPDLLDSISGEWSYLAWQDIQPKNMQIPDSFNDVIIKFGRENTQKQTLFFTPKESGQYDLILHNITPYTYFKIYDINGINKEIHSTSEIKTFNEMATYNVAKEPYLKFLEYFTKGKTYKIEIGNNSRHQYGACKLNIYKSDLSTIKTGSFSTGLNYTYRLMNNNGVAINNEIYANNVGQYYISANADNNSDTYITILDKNFNQLISSDNGIRMTLNTNEPYYVISRFKSINTTGQYKVNFRKQKYIPDINNSFAGSPISISTFGRTNNVTYFITTQSASRKVKLSAYWDTTNSLVTIPKVAIEIYNMNGKLLTSNTDITDKYFTYLFSMNTSYLIKLKVTTSCNINGLCFVCERI